MARPPSAHTIAAQQRVKDELPFHDRQSFEDAARGFIATLEPLEIAHDRSDRPAYSLTDAIAMLDADAPDSVNPSLWRQAQLNALHNGLYEVVDGIYQVRSFDISNITFIRSDTGWIVIDPLTSAESARAALDLINAQLGARPVVAVLYTHSHVDHFAGVLGVTTLEDAMAGKVAVIAPEHFTQEALNENVLAGNVMGRRATYMYGNLLPPSPTGFVSTGLGAALSMGSTGFVPPNDTIKATGETRTIDGVTFDFQMTPGTEAPAEFVFYLPQFKALCMAEITSHHLHNVYTPRGAQVRDALAWSNQIHESIERYGDQLEVQFASHHWPIWGRQAARDYLEKQRDLYKYIHDQTLRLANMGLNKEEIAEQVRLPDALGHKFYNRDYYGTVSHNVRAVFVKYLGYYDGNPATLNPLPPKQVGERYVEYMGGVSSVVAKARDSFEAGDYRWVVEVLNHVVMVDATHDEARNLLADAHEQLGYQAESGPWRNNYLCAALELREGVPSGSKYRPSEGMARGMPLENLFQTLAIRLNPDRADGLSLRINLQLTHPTASYQLVLNNSVLHAFAGTDATQPDATVTGDVLAFKKAVLGLGPTEELEITGNPDVLNELLSLFDDFERRFPLVTRPG